MKGMSTVIGAALTALLGGCASAPAGAAYEGVFIHVSKGPEDAHEVLMALKMASLMRGAGKDVLVYFDIDGVGAVVKDAPDVTHGGFESSRAQIGRLLEAGAVLCACPSCLEAAGKTRDDLMPGVEVASLERFFGFTCGGVLALDY
jgi:predicted peroxiredoxin